MPKEKDSLHKKLGTKADRTADETTGNNRKVHHFVMDLTISSDEEEENKAEEICRETDEPICQKTTKVKLPLSLRRDLKKRTKAERDNSKKGRPLEIYGTGEGSKNRMVPMAINDKNDSDTCESNRQELKSIDIKALSQSDKSMIRNAVKKRKLQQLVKSPTKEEGMCKKLPESSKSKLVDMISDKDPDETDDFSGGTTPYRAVINKNNLKMQELKKESKPNRRNLKRKKPKLSQETATSPERTSCEGDNLQFRRETTKDNTDVHGDKYIDMKKCVTCLQEIKKDEYAAHLSKCLAGKFKRIHKTKNSDSERRVGLHYCQICQEDISGLGVDDRSSHVNACIDKDAQTSNQTIPKAQETEADDGNDVVCQICKKNLSHHNSQRKMQHINRCADQVEELEKKRQEEQAALEKARKKVLDCPLCGQHHKTANGRRTHMKKCAVKYGVSAVTLQERIKQQEEEYGRELEAGVVPVKPLVKKRKRNPVASSSTVPARPEEPLNKMDADMQLAVALSESIRQESIDKISENEGMEGSGVTATNNAFSVLMTPKVQKHTKRKTKGKPVSTLMVARQEDVARSLSERVTNLLLPHESDEELTCTPQMPPSTVKSVKISSLWEKGVNVNFDKLDYYVKELMPPLSVTTVTCGSKLRRMSSIPGRQDTSIVEATPPQDETSRNKVDLNDTTMITTTQTALLLAEMDEDQSSLDKTCDTGKHLNTTGCEPDLNATGFIIPEHNQIRKSEEASYQRLMNEQEKMINNSMLSDLSLETRDGVVFTHKYAIAVRCPTLFKHVERMSKIDMQSFSKDSVLALLRYLYIDDTSPKQSIVEELEKLASRFGIQELVNICKDLLTRTAADAEQNEDSNLSQSSSTDLDALLKKVWGSDDETDESSDEEVIERRKVNEREREDAEIEAVYEYMASQRSNEHVKSDGSDEDGSESDEGGVSEPKEQKRQLSVHSYLEEDIINELLTPVTKQKVKESNSESDSEIAEKMEHLESEDVQLQLTESDSNETSDGNFEGSPLVRKFRQFKEKEKAMNTMMTEDAVHDDIHTICSDDIEYDQPERTNEQPDNSMHKVKISLCERCPLSIKELKKLSSDGISGNVTMSKKDFNTVNKIRPDMTSWSVTICDKCSPCKTVNEVRIKTSDKKILSQSASRTLDFASNARKSLYETPITSRTWSVANSITPDLFDTSTATEEYSIDLSHLSAYGTRERKCSGSASKLFTDDEHVDDMETEQRNHYDSDTMSDSEADVDCASVPELSACETINARRSNDRLVCEIENTESKNNALIECTTAKDQDNSEEEDDVMMLSRDEVAKLPKSRTPSPVFSSQMIRHGTRETDVPVNSSVIKEERELAEESYLKSDSSDNEEAKDSAWIRGHTPQSHKPKKVYSFKTKKPTKKSKDASVMESGETASTDCAADIDERNSRSFSLGQKRKTRRSSDSCSSLSFTQKRQRATDNKETAEQELGGKLDQSIEFRGSVFDENDPVDLTQDESSGRLQGSPGCNSDEQVVEDEVQSTVDEIPWHDEIDDGVLVMEEQFSPFKTPRSKDMEHIRTPLDSSMNYDPPTDYSMLLNDSVTWNDENEPKEPSSSENMMKTPSAPVAKKAKKPLSEWVPPSPFTPMPPYDSMTTPELKRHCKKYGVRPLPKKRMRETLKTLHLETHAWETDSEFEDAGEQNEGAHASVTHAEKISEKRQKYFQNEKDKRLKQNKEKEIGTQLHHDVDESSDSETTNDLDSSGSMPDLLEESVMPGIIDGIDEDEEDDITPSQVNASQRTKEQRAEAKKEKLLNDMKNYVRNNSRVYEKVLQYEVFEFDDFKADLKNAGIKVGNDLLIGFLDDMNIQFTWRSHQQGRRQKKGRGSPKKTRSPGKRGRGKGRGKRLPNACNESS